MAGANESSGTGGAAALPPGSVGIGNRLQQGDAGLARAEDHRRVADARHHQSALRAQARGLEDLDVALLPDGAAAREVEGGGGERQQRAAAEHHAAAAAALRDRSARALGRGRGLACASAAGEDAGERRGGRGARRRLGRRRRRADRACRACARTARPAPLAGDRGLGLRRRLGIQRQLRLERQRSGLHRGRRRRRGQRR